MNVRQKALRFLFHLFIDTWTLKFSDMLRVKKHKQQQPANMLIREELLCRENFDKRRGPRLRAIRFTAQTPVSESQNKPETCSLGTALGMPLRLGRRRTNHYCCPARCNRKP